MPELVRRVGRELAPPVFPMIPQPIRIPRSRLVRGPYELGRAVRLDCETIRDAKGRLNAFMIGETYHALTHQPSFAATLDIGLAARRSRSLRKLVAEVGRLLGST